MNTLYTYSTRTDEVVSYFRKYLFPEVHNYEGNNYHTYTMCTCTSTRTDFVSISHTFVLYCTVRVLRDSIFVVAVE